MAGIRPPDSGNIDNKSEKLGFVFQEEAFLNWLDIRTNLQLCHPLKIIDINLIERFQLTEHLDKFPKQLSGGTKQKFNLLRAFTNNPETILLDEPFSHLDQIQKEDLYNFTIELWNLNKPTIILVTHDIDEAIYLSHSLSFLSKKLKNISHTIEVKSKEDAHSSSLINERLKPQYSELFKKVYECYLEEKR